LTNVLTKNNLKIKYLKIIKIKKFKNQICFKKISGEVKFCAIKFKKIDTAIKFQVQMQKNL
jgi:hypothetical protein